MEPFSRRTGIRAEYSGLGEVSPELRARLHDVLERYLADEYEMAIGHEGNWVHTHELHHRLSMDFGRKVSPNEVLIIVDRSEWNEVLDAVESFLEVGRETAYHRYGQIHDEVARAFERSGSAYYMDGDGRVRVRVEEETARRIAGASETLGKNAQRAKQVFDEAVGGLLSRSKSPKDVVRDAYVALEEYLQQVTRAKNFDEAIKALQRKGLINRAQASILGRLQGYRSEVFGSAHAGEVTPTETEALWYVETIAVQAIAIDRVVRGQGPREEEK